MSAFSLGTIDFNNDVADANGVFWYGNVDGWDATEHRVEELTRPAQHGGITVANLYQAKQMTVFGTAVGENSTDYYASKNKIALLTKALTPFAAPSLTLMHPEEVDKQMTVLRTGLLSKCIETKHLQFELTLRADDPLKYAATASTLATSGVAVNTGGETTYPTFTLGSSGTPVLTLGAYTWTATASLPSGTVIDMSRLTAVNGVTNYFGNVNPASDWFGFAPGNNTVTSTVAGTWSWRSAWL